MLRTPVVIERASVAMTAGTPPVPVLDDYGQPARSWLPLTPAVSYDPDNPAFQLASIQVIKATEVPQFSQGGARDLYATIFLAPTDVIAADRIRLASNPTGPYWEISGVIDPAGRGHHLQLDAKLVQ